ncbi:MAG: 16S rRNA (cytosine(967)-C(5))-methyltransferase RsmB [Candidatus Cloacimonetes bacterium]|jgi:16S rRNA (cytosine967-C5)-methyltransferase|nr:16S rRNA (cytosine(967)-C(5))-methyltransferase RsmB [Candidatus Cloacimonadota bacterium]MDY0336523.1 16S rRNA (cytosine(967)-C(5))-methyltransferase RsmB [Candidatus Cloacimonadaceae bacterium]MCK9333932.1 16S rRNA (cytosine(967)-C(5))-methyltransferase RsmB [Candidatus Cloacimonadota bacterium]MDD2542942.1 16S rRNA (cytosine(967)-C(5))-methyltransferase RsmB [Candidatus Cloacimonadota bacterium]MDD2682612.1 16S rRNA (cytosine(967)-C(5))-methyltransferase RsmB [Candidatus Cloacimonadota ba
MNFRAEAYSTILKVLRNGEFSDSMLQQRAKKLKSSGEDVALFYTTVKGVIKMRQHLDFILGNFTDVQKYASTDLKIKIMLYLGIYQLKYLDSIPEHAAVNETVELAKSQLSAPVADFVNAVLRSYIRNPELQYPSDPVLRIANEHSYPPELIQKWISLWGMEDTEMLAIYFNENPELHIRVNQTATTAQKLEAYFERRSIKIVPSEASPMMFHTTQASEVLNEVAFSEGYFTVQDTSAALVVELLDPKPEQSVLDLFAAPGGKCTYIAERLNNTGEVIAVDKIPNKMKLLKQAADRLQLTNIKQIVTDALKYGPVAPAFDRVLVDAPCSGWGVFSRKADLRWQSHNDIAELVKLQEKALEHAANFVKPEGFMVYSTCTMNPEENEEQIKRFLARNPKFILVKAQSILPEKFTEAGFLKTIPFKHFMDGAFGAKLQRVK